LNEIETLLQDAVEAAARVERPAAKSADYVSIARVHLENGQTDRCLEVLKQAAAQAEKIKLPEEKAVCLAYIAGLFQTAGVLSASKEYFTRAVLLARAAETPAGQVKALTEIGWEYAGAGLMEEAAGVLESIKIKVKEPQNGLDTAFELTNMAELYMEIGKPAIAVKILSEAFQYALEIKDNWFKVERLIGIAEAHAAPGDTSGAAEILERVKSFLLNIDEVDRADFWLRTGVIYGQAGDKQRAFEALEAALKSIDINSEANYQVEKLVETAVEYLALGDKPKTLALLDRAGLENTEVEDSGDKITNLINISGVLGRAGEKERALETAGQALELCLRQPDKKGILYLLGNLAVVYAGLGDKEKAGQMVDTINTVTREIRVKTNGFGAIAVELAEAGSTDLALRLTGLVNDPHIKAESLSAIAANLVKSRPL
jgi:tetratricopeptide (TPR) repeat protein